MPRPLAHVLYVTDSTLPASYGQLVNNIKAVGATGIRTHFMLHPDSPIIPLIKDLDVDVILYDEFHKSIRSARFLKKVVRAKKIDLVHAFHNQASKVSGLAKMLGGKFRLIMDGSSFSRDSAVPLLWTAFADGITCNSAHCARTLQPRCLTKRFSVVHDDYSGPDFGEPKPRKKRGTRFIYVGDATDAKGYDIFLRSAATVCQGDSRDMEFVVAGLGDEDAARFDHLLTPGLRERLRNLGELDQTELLEELRFSDILCLTPRMEAFPSTLVAGFDLGLPAVATNVGILPELVQDSVNGYLCESENVDCLAEKMRCLADDPARRYHMGRVGRTVVRTLLTPEIMAQSLLRIYMGERLKEPLPIRELANDMNLDMNPYDDCKH